MDSVYAACCGICFIEVQSGRCLCCLLFSLPAVVIFFTEVHSEQCLCLYTILPVVVFFCRGTYTMSIHHSSCCGIFSQRYIVDDVCSACCGGFQRSLHKCQYCLVVFSREVQNSHLCCLLWYFSEVQNSHLCCLLWYFPERYSIVIYAACCGIFQRGTE